jgi:hypothetical protein
MMMIMIMMMIAANTMMMMTKKDGLLVIVRHDDIVDDDNESDDDDDYPGRWRSMATGKVTSGTKKKTSPIHNIFYLYECRKQSMCSLIVSRRNSIYRCTPENLQSRWRRERERGRLSVRLTERPKDRASDGAIE